MMLGLGCCNLLFFQLGVFFDRQEMSVQIPDMAKLDDVVWEEEVRRFQKTLKAIAVCYNGTQK